jgi:hypothetical protein
MKEMDFILNGQNISGKNFKFFYLRVMNELFFCDLTFSLNNNNNNNSCNTVFPRYIVCLRNISINTLHKGDDNDDDNNNNNNYWCYPEKFWLMDFYFIYVGREGEG